MKGQITHRTPKFSFLSGKTAIQSRISDHNFLIAGNVIFFNMMMQAKWNAEKKRFNNGFGLIENDLQYQYRIKLIVGLLAEAVAMNPQVEIIGLTEAPIRKNDIAIFVNEASKYPSLDRFFQQIKPELFSSMGVATFVDASRFDVNYIKQDEAKLPRSMKDRIQQFSLFSKNTGKKMNLFNFHLPFDLAKSKDNTLLVRTLKSLFYQQNDIPLIAIGDFNMNPLVIAGKINNVDYYIQKNNNILLKVNKKGKPKGFNFDTVDGILQSRSISNESLPEFKDANAVNLLGSSFKEFKMIKSFLMVQSCLFKSQKKRLNNKVTPTLAFAK